LNQLGLIGYTGARGLPASPIHRDTERNRGRSPATGNVNEAEVIVGHEEDDAPRLCNRDGHKQPGLWVDHALVYHPTLGLELCPLCNERD